MKHTSIVPYNRIYIEQNNVKYNNLYTSIHIAQTDMRKLIRPQHIKLYITALSRRQDITQLP